MVEPEIQQKGQVEGRLQKDGQDGQDGLPAAANAREGASDRGGVVLVQTVRSHRPGSEYGVGIQ